MTDAPTDPPAAEALRKKLRPVGIWSSAPDGLPVDEVSRYASRLEELGAGAVWYGEAYGRETFQQANLLLRETEHLLVGSSIASIYARDAVATRGGQATLNAVYDGRFVLGLGVSHAPLVERFRDQHYDKPLTAMREYLHALDGVQLMVGDAAPGRPRLLAALGPKMLTLSAEAADGALPYLTLPPHTSDARTILGPERALIVEHGAVIADVDEDEATRRTHNHLEIYTGLANYRNSWKRQGFEEDDLVRGGSDRLKSAMITHGLEATLDRITEHLEAGADQVAVQILGAHPMDPCLDDAERLLAAAAERFPGQRPG